jgi:hypothetical protein
VVVKEEAVNAGAKPLLVYTARKRKSEGKKKEPAVEGWPPPRARRSQRQAGFGPPFSFAPPRHWTLAAPWFISGQTDAEAALCISSSDCLTWWNSQTIGTQFFTCRKGVKVGEDARWGPGNIFYQTADGKRRWVIFNGECEASRVKRLTGMAGCISHGMNRRPRRR